MWEIIQRLRALDCNSLGEFGSQFLFMQPRGFMVVIRWKMVDSNMLVSLKTFSTQTFVEDCLITQTVEKQHDR